MKAVWALVGLLLLAAHPSFAETRSLGYAVWNVTGGNVRVLYSIPTGEAKELAAPGSPVLTTKQVADYVLMHLAVSRQGTACPTVDQPEVGLINTLAFTPGLLRFEIAFACQDGVGLTLSDTAFSDRITGHLDFARVQIDNGGFVEHVFSAAEPHFNLPREGGALRGDPATRYVALGLAHVFGSAEILCFMLALVLIARRRRDYILALSALAAGYALAVVLSTFHLAAPDSAAGTSLSGPLVFFAAAVSVALSLTNPRRAGWVLSGGALALALAALFVRGVSAGLAVIGIALLSVSVLFARERANQRAIILSAAGFLFALLDGFVLSGDLGILALPGAHLAPMLIGFNAGALLGELVLPLCLVAAWFLVPRIRPMTAPGHLLPDLAASVLIGCGVFWFGTWLSS